MKEEETPIKTDPILVDELQDVDIDQMLPTMNVGTNDLIQREECVIGDEKIVGLYDEILDNCRQDRTNADEILTNFLEMVMNDGDASSASKEAIVNLLKIKSDVSDKMAKVADLMTRIKLKEKDTFPRYLAAQQQNHVYLGENGSRRELIKTINKMKKDSEKSNAKSN